MKKVVLIISVLFSITFLSSSTYALTLFLSDGVTMFTITDNSALDLDTTVGSIAFVGSVGGFTTNISATISKPVVGSAIFPILHLSSTNVTGASGGSLLIRAFETDFSSTPFPRFFSSAGGVSGGTVILGSALYDNNDPPTGIATPLSAPLGIFGPGPFSKRETSPLVFPTDPFALALEANITHSGAGLTSFDFEVSPAPEPGTVLLLGTGLLGVGFWKRRKRKRNS